MVGTRGARDRKVIQVKKEMSVTWKEYQHQGGILDHLIIEKEERVIEEVILI